MTKNKFLVPVIIALLLGISLGIYYFAKPGNDDGVDLLGKVVDGVCTSRSGSEIVMCCYKEDPTTKTPVAVNCEDTVVDKKGAKKRALLTSGPTTFNIDYVQFAVKITNPSSNNVPLIFDVTNVEVTSSNHQAGATATEITDSENEWKGSWDDIVSIPPMSAAPGEFVEFSMLTSNLIRLTTSTFDMADGTYTSKVFATGTTPSQSVGSSDTTLMVSVAQETTGFTIEVVKV